MVKSKWLLGSLLFPSVFMTQSCVKPANKPNLNRSTSPDIGNIDKAPSDLSEDTGTGQPAPGISGIAQYLNSIGHVDTDANTDQTAKVICDGKDASPGQTCETKEEITMDGSKSLCTYQQKRQTIVPTEIAVVNANSDSLWPGALIQSQSVLAGALDPVPIKDRKPGTIVLTIASGGTGNFSKVLSAPSLASSTEAINEILSTNLSGPTPAKFSYRIDQIHDQQQIKLALKASFNALNWGGAASLNFNAEDEKNRILVEFTQEYYTMAFEAPQGVDGVFGPSVKVQDIMPYAGPSNPLLYVSSVTYGRRFYFLFESTSSLKDLETAVSGRYGNPLAGAKVSLSTKYKNIINESNIKAFAIGGNAADAVQAVTGARLNEPNSAKSQLDIIHEFLVKGAEFNDKNAGVPIAYSLRYIDDSSSAKIGFTTEFRSKDCVATSALAKFFSDSDFKGYPLVLPIGRYTLDDLNKLGMKNDSVSSIQMPAELKAVIWQNGDLTGKNFEILSDSNNLGSIDFNDAISSIEVMSR